MGLRDVGWASEWVSVFLDILYHFKRTKTAFMISSSRRPIHPFLNKKSVSWKADQRASIFKFWDWRNLFAFLTSLYWWAKRPPKSKDTLSWKQEKKTRFDGPTHTHKRIRPTYIHPTHTHPCPLALIPSMPKEL